MGTFEKRRMYRLFGKDGRTLIVAMDHVGFMDRPLPGLDDPVPTVRKVVAGGADVIMTTQGTAQACLDAIGQAGLIISVLAKPPALEEEAGHAVRLGADGVKCMMYPWKANEPDSLANVARLAAECRKWGMPLLVETVPGGFEAGPEMRTPEKIAAAARIGVEMGADFIKTFFTTERFDVVTHNVPVPIVILGGEKAASERDLLESVKKAMDAGAKGVAIGRNIWQHAHPDRITAAIAAIVHGNATVEQALKELG